MLAKSRLIAVKGVLQYPKTVPASPLAAAIKESSANAPQKRKQTHGNPSFRVFRNTFGACPLAASPYSVREETKRSAVPADQALVSIAALMIDGKTEIPAFCFDMLAHRL